MVIICEKLLKIEFVRSSSKFVANINNIHKPKQFSLDANFRQAESFDEIVRCTST